jgi:hypothetical protein
MLAAYQSHAHPLLLHLLPWQNIRFYCELAKFKVAQPHSILHVYKVLIDDLTGSNVECAALLLEGCGRFLLRSEHTGERMKSMVCPKPSSFPHPACACLGGLG